MTSPHLFLEFHFVSYILFSNSFILQIREFWCLWLCLWSHCRLLPPKNVGTKKVLVSWFVTCQFAFVISFTQWGIWLYFAFNVHMICYEEMRPFRTILYLVISITNHKFIIIAFSKIIYCNLKQLHFYLFDSNYLKLFLFCYKSSSQKKNLLNNEDENFKKTIQSVHAFPM